MSFKVGDIVVVDKYNMLLHRYPMIGDLSWEKTLKERYSGKVGEIIRIHHGHSVRKPYRLSFGKNDFGRFGPHEFSYYNERFNFEF